jgi:CDGSH-type Zn-finger protein
MNADAPRRVQIAEKGPMLVEGPVRIDLPDGQTVESDRFLVAICTCRRSKIYPLCDASHRPKHAPQADRSDERPDDQQSIK